MSNDTELTTSVILLNFLLSYMCLLLLILAHWPMFGSYLMKDTWRLFPGQEIISSTQPPVVFNLTETMLPNLTIQLTCKRYKGEARAYIVPWLEIQLK